MSIRMKISRQPKKWNEKTWIRHSLKEIVAFFKRLSTIILGAMEVEKQVSDKDKWKRKKYIGLPSVWLVLIVVIIRKLPSNAPKSKSKNVTNTIFFLTGSRVTPSRMNSVTLLFSCMISWMRMRSECEIVFLQKKIKELIHDMTCDFKTYPKKNKYSSMKTFWCGFLMCHLSSLTLNL